MIVKAIPKNIKVAIGSAIGFYIACLGFKNSGIGIFTNGIGMENFMEPAIFIALLGLILIAILTAYRVKGAILTGIIAVTVMGIPLGAIAPGYAADMLLVDDLRELTPSHVFYGGKLVALYHAPARIPGKGKGQPDEIL